MGFFLTWKIRRYQIGFLLLHFLCLSFTWFVHIYSIKNLFLYYSISFCQRVIVIFGRKYFHGLNHQRLNSNSNGVSLQKFNINVKYQRNDWITHSYIMETVGVYFLSCLVSFFLFSEKKKEIRNNGRKSYITLGNSDHLFGTCAL